MAVPDFQSLMLPLLQFASDGAEHSLGEALERLAVQLGLDDADRKELLPSGKQPRFDNRLGWAATYLRKTDLLRSAGRGRFQITVRGREVLASRPAKVDLKFLQSRFAELEVYRSGKCDRQQGAQRVVSSLRRKPGRSTREERFVGAAERRVRSLARGEKARAGEDA